MDIKHLKDDPNVFGKFLEKLQHTQISLTQQLKQFKQNYSSEIPPELIQDVEKMLSASQAAEKFILDGFDINSKAEATKEDWRKIRHDLRATIGAISGYSELVMEDLEESDLLTPTMHRDLRLIRENAQEQMPFIDKLRHEDNTGYIKPNGGAYEEPLAAEEGNGPPKKNIHGKILVVDDDEHKRNILYRRLKKNGHKVLLAENGYRALDILERETIDLILLDIIMPGISGIEVLKKLKENHKYMNIPVLVISSLNDVESVVECIKIGAQDYLPMPFNPVLLMARVNTCLDKKLLRDKETESIDELDRMRQQLEAALESIEDGFAVFNLFDEMTMCNKKFEELYPAIKTIDHPDYSYREFLEANYLAGRYHIESRRKLDKEVSFEDWIELRMSRHQYAKEPYMEKLNDNRWIEISENRTADGGTVSIHKDVTASKEDEDRLKYLVHHDPLTGLANRSLFEENLHTIFNEALKGQRSFAVMYLDLDGFKKVNDTLGHEFGDFLLIEVADKILESVRDDDIVARLGGDEFAILMTDIDGVDSVKKTATRILKQIGNSVERDGKQAQFGMSIGIALYPGDGTSIEDVLSKADQAMYAAKKSGKGFYRLASEI